jgi:hypothetical protein
MKLKKKAILYLEGMLNKEESDEFLKKIKTRTDIQDFMKEYRWIDSKLKSYSIPKQAHENGDNEDPDLNRLAIKDIHKYYKNYKCRDRENEEEFILKLNQIPSFTQKKAGINLGFFLNLAATLAFLAIIVTAIIHIVRNTRAEEYYSNLFAEYFTPYYDIQVQQIDSEYVIRGNNSLDLSERGKIIDKQNIVTLLRSDRMDIEDMLLISIILIQEDELVLAGSYLSGIIEKSDSSIAESARWYLALIHLRQGNTEEAVLNLEVLCNENSSYTAKSCKLLGTLYKKSLD